MLERDAINLCSQRTDSIEMKELNAVAKLYTRIFHSRWIRGLRIPATSIGYTAIKLTTSTNSIDLKLIVLPRLIQVVMAEGKLAEAVAMLEELGINGFCKLK